MFKLRIKVTSLILIALVLTQSFPVKESGVSAGNDGLQSKLEKALSFYVGKVSRTYKDTGESDIWSVDLSQYIDTQQRKISSATEQLLWDYGKGIVEINTPKTQGASGFLNKTSVIDLDDVLIKSGNDYATVLVTALDDKPIGDSEQIMIQAMTEDKFYGATTVNKTITNLGSAPLNVKNIDVTITLKGKSNMKNIIVCDENGYGKELMTKKISNNDLEIKLRPNAVYTVVTNDSHIITDPYEKEQPNYVWWEGENPVEDNFPRNSWFSTYTEGNWDVLSEGDWLSNSGNRTASQAAPYAKYLVNVPSNGEYDLWVRKFWKHGPFRWRFGQNNWTYVGTDIDLADSVSIRTNVGANWVYLGKVNLPNGNQSFEIELTAGVGQALTAGFDCFMLTQEAFVPRGKLKPGGKTGNHESGYWAFEPPADTFLDALVDLRSLNEEIAGQSGFVRKDGGNFVLGDGNPVKFWAVNATANLNKNNIDYMARRLAKYGVNMVRFHGAIFDSGSANLSVNKNTLDKLHYYVSAMKKQGIYVNISTYFPLWLDIEPKHGIEGYDTIDNKRPFALLMFDPKFQNLYKNWVREMLTTVNPYTGLSLANDPAVAIIEVQNEDNCFFWTFTRNNIPEVQMNKLEKIFGDWLIEKYGSLQNALNAWGSGSSKSKDNISAGRMMLQDAWYMTRDGYNSGNKKRMGDQVQFLTEHQKKFYEEMVDFLRNDVKTKSLISASNWTTADNVNLDPLERYTYTATDIIDRHGYQECNHRGDAAGYSVREGDTYDDVSIMRNPEEAIVKVIQTENYPHMITETAWTNPSKYKGESVPIWSVYGALQGMDAIHLFSVGTGDWEATPTKWPVMIPSVLGQFPGFALMYRRGDVVESDSVVRITQSLEDLYNFKGTEIYENQALDIIRQMPSPKPTPITTPSPVPTNSPLPTPTREPSAEHTNKPQPTNLPQPTNTPQVVPSQTPTVAPTNTPDAKITPKPEPEPSPTQRPKETLTIKVNKKKVNLKTRVYKGKIVAVAKRASKLLGAKYKYKAKKKVVRINRGKTKIILRIGKGKATINKRKVKIKPKPFLKKGKVFVSLKFLSRRLGYKFKKKQNTVTINKK